LFLMQLGLAGLVGGCVLTAVARVKKLEDRWETAGLWAILGGFGLIMVGVAMAVATF
jgi:hypothetical protein